MSYRLIDSNNSEFLKDGFITQDTANEMPCIYADLPNGMDGGMYLAIPAHEGMTNGDMIMAMFPDADVIIRERDDMKAVFVKFKGMPYTRVFTLSWWNSPYKESEG